MLLIPPHRQRLPQAPALTKPHNGDQSTDICSSMLTEFPKELKLIPSDMSLISDLPDASLDGSFTTSESMGYRSHHGGSKSDHRHHQPRNSRRDSSPRRKSKRSSLRKAADATTLTGTTAPSEVTEVSSKMDEKRVEAYLECLGASGRRKSTSRRKSLKEERSSREFTKAPEDSPSHEFTLKGEQVNDYLDSIQPSRRKSETSSKSIKQSRGCSGKDKDDYMKQIASVRLKHKREKSYKPERTNFLARIVKGD